MELAPHIWHEYGGAITTIGVALVGVVVAHHLLGSLSSSSRNHSNIAMQAIMLPPEKKGESHVYRSLLAPDKLVETYVSNVTTLYENFRHGLDISANRNCLGWRQGNGTYQWLTYQEVHERFIALGSGLVQLGFKPKDIVGIFSRNRPEWVLTEQAANAFSMILVPLYDTLGAEAVQFIVTQTQTRIVFCTPDKIKQLEPCLAESNITHVVTFEPIEDEGALATLRNHKIDVRTIDEVIKMGKENPADPVPPKPDDLCTIGYTSGTTGVPKGVMLSHRNFIANVAGVLVSQPGIIRQSDISISYLPLAHAFERLLQATLFSQGGSVGFYRGTVPELFDDIAELKPTIFPSVPRLFNRLYDKVMAQRAELTGLKKFLFEEAWSAKVDGLKRGYFKHALWDWLVFSKIGAKLGGSVRLMVTGSAPISAEVKDFLRICFSVDMIEGYGQTECCAAACAAMPSDLTSGHVGPPLPNSDIKLVDVPEMGYRASDTPNPRGEICFRGPSVFSGYYKAPEKTAETLDEDGWLHSGDIGEMLPNGTLRIIDRKKDIFKLSQGEYIAPDKLASAYQKSPMVAQIFIYGNSLKASLVAVVVPDSEVLLPWAKQKGLEGDLKALCKNAQVKKKIQKSLKKAGEKAHLMGFERLADIYLDHESFSLENNLVTPTFKLKRPELYKYYKQSIEDMLAKLD